MSVPWRRLLDSLEQQINASLQCAIHRRHVSSLRWEPVDRLPLVVAFPFPPDCPFQPVPYSRAYLDREAMLWNELLHAFGTSIYCHAASGGRLGGDLPYTIRANFGTGIVASLYGARVEQIEENPPWVRPLESAEAVRRVLERDPLDLRGGLMPKIVETYQCYAALLAEYPTIRRVVRRVLPDLQGPFDTAELLRGSDLYLDLYEEPDLVERLLLSVSSTQVAVARALQPLLADTDDACHQHATVVPGHILIRDDSPTNMSAASYRQHVAVHDDFVLAQMQGGSVHYCGNGSHLMYPLLELPSLRGIDIGQPELNPLDTLYASVATRHIPLLRVSVGEWELRTGQVLQRFPTGVSLVHRAASPQEAGDVWRDYAGVASA